MYKITFNNKNNSFYQDLKSSVEKYFSTNHIRRTGNWRLYIKALVLVPAAIGLYLLLLLAHLSLISGILMSGLLGFVLASIGFNIMHDACHGSYSGKSWVNNIMGLSLNLLGGNAFIWKFKHNIIHHTYTNIDGIDDDIAKSPVMRQCESQKWVKAHRLSAYLCSGSVCGFFFCLGIHDGFHEVFQTKNTQYQSAENGFA